MKRSLGFVLLAILGLVSTATSATSASTWSEPQTLLDDDQPIRGLDVGIGPDGYAVVAWVTGGFDAVPDAAGGDQPPRVWASVRPPGADAFKAPIGLSGRGGHSMQLAVSPGGQTVVTWRGRGGAIRAAFRGTDSGWSGWQSLASESRSAASLAIGPDGTAVATWRSGRGGTRIDAAVRPPDGTFGERETIARDADVGVFGPITAVGGGGRALVTWSGRCPLADEDQRRRTRAVVLRRVGGAPHWEQMQEIPNSKCPTSHLTAAMSDDGRAAVVISGHLRSWNGIRTSVRAPGGSFERAELVSKWGQHANFADVGMDKNGATTVAWGIFERGGHRKGIRVSTRPPEGEFTDPVRVGGRSAGFEEIEVGRRGHAVIVWHGLKSTRIKAVYREPDGWFGEPESVSPPLTDQALALPVVAVNQTGRALATWGDPDSSALADGVFAAERD